ncbi:MAG: NAD(P)/FAD-dependent oxidoreductase [Deltaproteobacteria bacterium]|nr:MAG: NAD(P)/FAD-dependent oxidoreductase [Deltaproteobacteria bacterium]
MTAAPDLVILGAGTTALAAAERAAELGARVVVIEQAVPGGTCINWGCIPSKTLIHKAALYHAARRGAAAGLNLTPGPVDCAALMAAKQQAIDRVRQERCDRLLNEHPAIRLVRGHGRLRAPGEVQVGPEILRSDHILIACGGLPRHLDLPGMHTVAALNSYSVLNLPAIPRSLLIVGGGVIALEIGQMLQRFGCQVTLLERGDRPLAEFDPRLTGPLCALLAAEGLRQHFGVEVRQVAAEGEGVAVAAMINGHPLRLTAERLMLAVGTVPATAGLGLEAVGVACDRQGFVVIDAECRTSVPGIWAAGDVTGPPLLAPAGELEGRVAVENMFAGRHCTVDHHGTPMAVFIDPEIALVGQTAAQAGAAGHEVAEAYLDLAAVAKAHVVGAPTGALLLWADRHDGRLLGGQILAPRAADLIHELALAVRACLTVSELADSVHVYPTISDGWRLAARRLLADCPELRGRA